MVCKRISKALQLGGSIVVVLPKDWTRGMDIRKGDEVLVEYDAKEVRISVLK